MVDLAWALWHPPPQPAAEVGRARPLKLRIFNSRTGQDFFTANGRDYYAHNRQRFIINLPCKGYIAPAIGCCGAPSTATFRARSTSP